ncbi:hypothetical protein BH20ACI1_BH20ACI1_14790 [soil metagenome]
MLDTNHQNSSCAFAEQLVSYLYNEANAQEKSVFESHLTNCENCADELSAFGFVRSSVQQWRTEEFLPMKTPAMEIPFEKSPETVINSTEKRSRLADLRQLFALSPTWATASAAFVLLTVCVGLTFVAINFYGSNDVAERKQIAPEKSIISPAIENKAEQNVEVSDEIAKETSSDKIAEPFEENPKVENLPRVAPKNSTVKISNNTKRTPKIEITAQNSNNSAPVRKLKDLNNINKAVVAKNQQLPKLADFDEVEDNSLRLSDLMAEVEDK